MQLPSPEDLLARLRSLDELDRKVTGGMVALCIAAPDRLRDREWMAQRFVHVATVAHGFDAEDGPATDADVERIRAYAQARMDAVLTATLLLFVRTAEDLRLRGGSFTFADAQQVIAGYLG
ncbi:MAG: hypothetical protein JNK15_02590 [Planctomycetes bacterium]|nr:hypothetical protein [Planctomycetota bacterium]